MPPTEARPVLDMPRFCYTEDRLAKKSRMSPFLSLIDLLRVVLPHVFVERFHGTAQIRFARQLLCQFPNLCSTPLDLGVTLPQPFED